MLLLSLPLQPIPRMLRTTNSWLNDSSLVQAFPTVLGIVMSSRLLVSSYPILSSLITRNRIAHHIVNTGYYLGYGADSFPGVKQAIRDRNWPVAQQQVKLFYSSFLVLTTLFNYTNRQMCWPAVFKPSRVCCGRTRKRDEEAEANNQTKKKSERK